MKDVVSELVTLDKSANNTYDIRSDLWTAMEALEVSSSISIIESLRELESLDLVGHRISPVEF